MPRTFLELGEQLGAFVSASGRTANDELGLLGTVFSDSGLVDTLLAFDYRIGDDLELGDGMTLAFSELDTTNLLMKGGFDITANQRLEASFDKFNDDGQTALNGEQIITDPSEAGDREGERTTARLAYDLSPSLWWLDLHAVAYTTTTSVEEERLSDQRLEQREVETHGLDLFNTMRIDIGDPVENSLTYGVEYFRDDNERATLRPGASGPPDPADPTALPSFPDATGDQVGLYLQNDIRLFDRLTLIPGIRYDSFDIESDDADDFIARDVDLLAGTTTFENIDEAEIDGFEASLTYDNGSVFGGLTFSRIRGDNLVDDEPLVDMPADEWALDLGWRFDDPALTIGYRGTYAEEQNRVATDERPTDDYLVHDAYVSWTGTDGPLGSAEIGFRVNNLFDENYRRAGSDIKEADRDFRLTLSMRV